jgi:hypothetical protein
MMRVSWRCGRVTFACRVLHPFGPLTKKRYEACEESYTSQADREAQHGAGQLCSRGVADRAHGPTDEIGRRITRWGEGMQMICSGERREWPERSWEHEERLHRY